MKSEKFYQIIGLRIRKQRRALDITQKQLGDRLGVVASFICEMEKGKKAISAHTLFLLEKEIGQIWGDFKS